MLPNPPFLQPTYLFFHLSRWLVQGEAAPLSLVHKSTVLAYFFHTQAPCMAHCRPVTPGSPGTTCLGVLGAFSPPLAWLTLINPYPTSKQPSFLLHQSLK